jgi:undecaprenol kinase/diacylglycerol kinase (ATP)
VIAAAVVLGIGWMQWIAIAGCLTLVLTAEMFNQALKALAQSGGQHSSPDGQRALAIGTAAVLVACVGSLIVLTLVFWQRFEQLF